jgi:hypothetical protein
VSLTPNYSVIIGRSWLARVGTFVVANIRGGGEYGPAWHQAVLKDNRLRVYEDFAAVARDLVDRGITTPSQLGIQGGSNGGLLMGVMLTRYPELFGAIGCQVPLLDMRRYHLLLAGASWMAEYGDPDEPAEWEYLRQYSPYHNIERNRECSVAVPPRLAEQVPVLFQPSDLRAPSPPVRHPLSLLVEQRDRPALECRVMTHLAVQGAEPRLVKPLGPPPGQGVVGGRVDLAGDPEPACSLCQEVGGTQAVWGARGEHPVRSQVVQGDVGRAELLQPRADLLPREIARPVRRRQVVPSAPAGVVDRRKVERAAHSAGPWVAVAKDSL